MNFSESKIRKLLSLLIVFTFISFSSPYSYSEESDDSDYSVIYTVKPNDDIFKIAKKFNIDYHKIMQVNNLKSPYLNVGKQLTLENISIIPESEKVIYTISPHDNVYKISDRFNIDFGNLMSKNNIKNPYLLYIGQKLILENKKKNKPVKKKISSKYALLASRVSYTIYTAKNGDDLYKIARKYNKNYRDLAKLNNLSSSSLRVNQKVIIHKEMLPSSYFSGILINIPEQRLYLFSDSKFIKSYEIATGLRQKEWQTPLGNFKVITKSDFPSTKNKHFGKWWLAFNEKSGIHFANIQESIDYSISHGCIRMYSRDAEDLFKRVNKGTQVKIIYQPVKASIDESNNIFLEVYQDIYDLKPYYLKMTREILYENKINKNINWDTVSSVISQKKAIKYQISN